jgi:cbb3-type cytochrome oxidase subunit 3
MTIETFLLFAAIFVVFMTLLGGALAAFAYRSAKKSMKEMEGHWHGRF